MGRSLQYSIGGLDPVSRHGPGSRSHSCTCQTAQQMWSEGAARPGVSSSDPPTALPAHRPFGFRLPLEPEISGLFTLRSHYVIPVLWDQYLWSLPIGLSTCTDRHFSGPAAFRREATNRSCWFVAGVLHRR